MLEVIFTDRAGMARCTGANFPPRSWTDMTAALEQQVFLQIVANAPLVSIDLIVANARDEILLGQRVNAPARGAWFVPGGRIRKNETMANAYARVCNDELGMYQDIRHAMFAGVYEHFYDDNFAGAPGISTHYVVMAYRLTVAEALTPPHEQHSVYRWVKPGDIAADDSVHRNTRAYFTD